MLQTRAVVQKLSITKDTAWSSKTTEDSTNLDTVK